jgi:hypothetical protein
LSSVSYDGYVSLKLGHYRVTDPAGNFSEPSKTNMTRMIVRFPQILKILINLTAQSPQDERVI